MTGPQNWPHGKQPGFLHYHVYVANEFVTNETVEGVIH
jgi:hypothetical protein